MKTVRQPAARAGVDIAPAVADHEARARGRCRGRARASSSSPGAGLRHAQSSASSWKQQYDRVERQLARSCAWIASTASRVCVPRADIGLIRDDDQREAGALAVARAPARRPARIASPSTRAGGYGLPSRTTAALSTPSRSRKTAREVHGSVDSHFVCTRLSFGCETSRCQTTAWNASACGVMLPSLTVGRARTRRDLLRVAAVAPDHADDARADFAARACSARDEVRADVLLEVAAADREDEQRVVLVRSRLPAQPLDEDGRPALVVRARGRARTRCRSARRPRSRRSCGSR